MSHNIRHAGAVISLEARAGLTAIATGRLPDFFASVKGTFNTYLAQPLKNMFSARGLSWFAREIAKASYPAMRGTEVYIPAGLKTDYLTYGKVLETATESMASLKHDVLQPFQKWLAQKLGNPSSLNSLTADAKIENYKSHATPKLEKSIQDCFNLHGKQEVVTAYENAVKRNADWAAISAVADKLNAAFSDAAHKEIVDQVNEITGMMDTLMRRIKEDPDTYKLSATSLTLLSNVSLALAQEIEFYGLLRHRMGEYSKAVVDTMEKLEGQINK